MDNKVPRRNQLNKLVPAEAAIYAALEAVERMEADVRLTDAVVLLQAARESVADYVDGVPRRRFVRVGSRMGEVIDIGRGADER